MYDENSLGNIGMKIKMLRTKNKIAQQVLAKTLGISQTHMSNMETGRVNVTLHQLLRIANIFNCRLDDFLKSGTDKEETTEKESATYSVEEVRLLLEMLKLDKK